MKHNLNMARVASLIPLVVNRDIRYNRKPMSTITTNDVRHLAQLSNLQLSDEEVTNLQVDLENILGYIDQLGSLDTSGVEPTYQVTGLENVWRTDTVVYSNVSREQLLALAPEATDTSVKVPKVL
jgi:aspartyl-tRNA(Asn)/glutamyl-tRNA(Gln) amidotransferase subunit C